MVWTLVAIGGVICVAGQSSGPGAKAMFYSPGGVGANPPIRFVSDPSHRLREVNRSSANRHCGLHFWLEDPTGKAVTVTAGSATAETYSLWVRASCDGFLTAFDVTGSGRELTPRMDSRWSGFELFDQVFRVPGSFRFSNPESQHIVLVWARSQTEVAGSAAHARQRLIDMPRLMPIVSESEESVAGEIGTYVVNRTDAGVPAEIVFRSR